MLKVMACFPIRLLCTSIMQGIRLIFRQDAKSFWYLVIITLAITILSPGSSLANLFTELPIITCFLLTLLPSAHRPGVEPSKLGLAVGSLLLILLIPPSTQVQTRSSSPSAKTPDLYLLLALCSAPKQMIWEGQHDELWMIL